MRDVRSERFRRRRMEPLMNKLRQAAITAHLLVAALLLPLAAAGQEPRSAETGETGEQVSAQQPEGTEPGAAEEAEEGAEEEAEPLSVTGDEWVDAQLEDIGRYARRHPAAFADELQRYYDAPRASVARLLEEGWAAGDVYFACALGRVTGRSCRFVVDQRGNPPRIGWRALAGDLGAGVGTEAFGRLKRGIVESYSRWARPLELDAELERAFPDRPRPAQGGAGG